MGRIALLLIASLMVFGSIAEAFAQNGRTCTSTCYGPPGQRTCTRSCN